MKRKKILTALVLVLALAGAFALGAGAAGGSQAITATLNYGLTVEYNGDVQTMTDANGVQVYPISYPDGKNSRRRNHPPAAAFYKSRSSSSHWAIARTPSIAASSWSAGTVSVRVD